MLREKHQAEVDSMSPVSMADMIDKIKELDREGAADQQVQGPGGGVRRDRDLLTHGGGLAAVAVEHDRDLDVVAE